MMIIPPSLWTRLMTSLRLGRVRPSKLAAQFTMTTESRKFSSSMIRVPSVLRLSTVRGILRRSARDIVARKGELCSISEV